MKKKILVTGAAGFIGSNFVKKICLDEKVRSNYNFLILDALTYAGHYPNIQKEIENNDNLSFIKGDIRDQDFLGQLFAKEKFDGVMNFAAESHVDRSIENPNIFFETNALGSLNLLNLSLKLWKDSKNPDSFRFLQVSTDEVYGTLTEKDPAFTEENQIQPNSPYSASKASGDLMVRAFYETYKMPVIITRCSNNYGPFQFPEKLIPVMIDKAVKNQPLPVYGNGQNIRDWIHVDDHCRGVWAAFTLGKKGEVYNFGGDGELRNLELVKRILDILGKPQSLISYVQDRLGHDFRYAINSSKAKRDLNWRPLVDLDQGIKDTVQWYLNNSRWIEEVRLSKKS
jgi:dTDP-glucose 4,6-dehydratase